MDTESTTKTTKTTNRTESNSLTVEKETGVSHSFYLESFTTPKFCYFCGYFIWGTENQGFMCSVCSICIHRLCISKIKKTCSLDSPKAQWLKLKHQLKEQNPHQQIEKSKIKFDHHWVETEFKFSAMCSVCEASIMLDGLIGYECTRCASMIHTSCRAQAPKQCSPRHKDLIYVPEYDNEIDSSNNSNSNNNTSKNSSRSGTPTTQDLSKLKEYTSYKERKPLLIFVNRRSGAKEGTELAKQFSDMLSAEQVFDLDEEGGPQDVLESFKNVRGLRIMVCGGDGTIGWVIGYLHKIGFKKIPPVGILPLGTGNDLARTLGWGSGYNGESLSWWLVNMELATIVQFDTWAIRLEVFHTKENEDSVRDFVMNNYCSFGVDAQTVLNFHEFRKQNPDLTAGQWINKFWYALYGGAAIFTSATKLNAFMKLKLDGKEVPIPEDPEGIIILNVSSYASGSDLWGGDEYNEGSTKFSKPSYNDKKLEIVFVNGSFHMAAVSIDLTSAIRFAQAENIEIEISDKIQIDSGLPFHIDGEPMLLESGGKISIKHQHQVPVLIKPEIHEKQ